MTKPPTHSPWLFTPKCNLHGALCGVQCFLPLDRECIEQTADVICPVLGVVCLAIPMTQSWGSLPHQCRVNRKLLKQAVRIIIGVNTCKPPKTVSHYQLHICYY